MPKHDVKNDLPKKNIEVLKQTNGSADTSAPPTMIILWTYKLSHACNSQTPDIKMKIESFKTRLLCTN